MIARVQLSVRHTGRAKLAHGKRHATKHSAGIIVAGLDTFLIGNAILGRLDEILSGANDTNDREDAKRHRQIALTVSVRQSARNAMTHRFGNLTATTAALTFRFLFANARAQNDGIDDFRFRYVIGK